MIRQPKSKRGFEDKWTAKMVPDGFVQISNFFLENYHKLTPYCLTHGEAMFVIHIMQFKWDENSPFPSYKTLAERMGVSEKQARRQAVSLENKEVS